MKGLLIKVKSSLSFKKINPHAHWKKILYLFMGVIIILMLFSFYLLYKIKNQQIFQTSIVKTEAPSLLNKKLLDKTTESFNNKLIKEKEIKNGIYLYEDPSLR